MDGLVLGDDCRLNGTACMHGWGSYQVVKMVTANCVDMLICRSEEMKFVHITTVLMSCML